jgi:hypothetical protein
LYLLNSSNPFVPATRRPFPHPCIDSLCGVIVLLITLRKEQLERGWDGLILNSAMFGVNAGFKSPLAARALPLLPLDLAVGHLTYGCSIFLILLNKGILASFIKNYQ